MTDSAMSWDAVVVAAGASTRFGGVDKLFAPLERKPVLAWALTALARAAGIGRMIVVTGADNVEPVRALATDAGLSEVTVAVGGARRRDSVEAGLRRCESRIALVHDGARPLVTPELASRVLAALASGASAAVASVPLTDTVALVQAGRIEGNIDRGAARALQTPQAVVCDHWLAAAATDRDDATDESALLVRNGYTCVAVEGDPMNIKITRPADLAVATALLALRVG